LKRWKTPIWWATAGVNEGTERSEPLAVNSTASSRWLHPIPREQV
jgi:hypothetical protein